MGPERAGDRVVGILGAEVYGVGSAIDPTGLAVVHVRVDQTGADEEAAKIRGPSPGRRGAFLGGADADKPVAPDDDDALPRRRGPGVEQRPPHQHQCGRVPGLIRASGAIGPAAREHHQEVGDHERASASLSGFRAEAHSRSG